MSNKRKWWYISKFWLLHGGMLLVAVIAYFVSNGGIFPAIEMAALIYVIPAFAHYIRGFGTRKEMEDYYLWSRR